MRDDLPEGKPPSYKPSAYYWRKKIRAEGNIEELRKIAMALVAELEDHKAFIRSLGHWPPKERITELERADKSYQAGFSSPPTT